MEQAKNLCTNGDFENLQEAAARPLPQDWQEVMRGDSWKIDVSEDAFQGKHSLHLSAASADVAGMNGPLMNMSHGMVRFHYKVLKSSVDGQNLELFVVGMNGAEVRRQGFTPPAEHTADGKWHEASFEFDFTAQQVENCLVAPRINEMTPNTGDGEWLIDAVEVTPLKTGPRVRVAHVWSDKPLARTGEEIRFSAWIESDGDEDARDASVRITTPLPVSGDAVRTIPLLPRGSYERVDWTLRAEKTGSAQVEVSLNGRSATGYKILVIDPRAHYTRQELMTDAAGYWRLLDRPSTLQEGNSALIKPIKHLKSSQIKHNTYGICAHLPRSKDYEDPFNPSHLIDGDPETCWSSQQNSSPYPGAPPWAEIDLSHPATIKQINLVPYWRNTDFPPGFSVRTSVDGKSWETVLGLKNYRFDQSGPRQGDKIVQQFPLNRSVTARFVRIEFERLPLSGGNYAEVSQGYKARLSGIEVIDGNGRNLALTGEGASVKVSNVFTGWQNTAKTVNESFHRIFDIGLKWVRVGQWGDQTEWAAVEREKGEFSMDAATDAGLRELFDNGVDVLYGLNYGNNLYEHRDTPFGDIGPIYTEGHPFYKNCGPRTEEGREAFVRYVDYVVRRYGDRIKWWELWNEENGWYPGHEPELYGKLLYAVAKHIKSINPDLKVMFGGTAAPAPITTGIALDGGGAPYVDAYAFHPYGIDKPEGGMGTMEFYQGKNLSQSREQTGWNHLEEIVEGVKKPFREHGKRDVEVWLDEWGTNLTGLDFTYNPSIGEYGCAKYLMRFYIYSGWLGHPTAWWALYNMNMSQDWGIIDQKDYGFRPMSYALQNVCTVVSDVTPIRALDYRLDSKAPDPKVIGYTRDDGSGKLVLAWAAETNNEEVRSYPSELSFALDSRPKKVSLIDLYWGVSQPAVWSYENGRLTVERLVVRDYPVAVVCE